MGIKRGNFLKLAAVPGTRIVYVLFVENSSKAFSRIPDEIKRMIWPEFRLPLEFQSRLPHPGFSPFRVNLSELNNN
jgi:hypothetical protein